MACTQTEEEEGAVVVLSHLPDLCRSAHGGVATTAEVVLTGTTVAVIAARREEQVDGVEPLVPLRTGRGCEVEEERPPFPFPRGTGSDGSVATAPSSPTCSHGGSLVFL